MPYVLPGPLPAGDYVLRLGTLHGGSPSNLIRAEILLRTGGGDTVLVAADGPGIMVNVTESLAAVNAACGDELVLTVTYVSGADTVIDFYVEHMQIP